MNENNFGADCTTSDFYFCVWCEELGIAQIDPWKIRQSVAQDAQTAVEMFAKDYDERYNSLIAKSCSSQYIIIFVSDWRGIITKFEIEVESQPVYNARSI